jgi:hypothetical protein
MRLPWRPDEYQRTCLGCGETWPVPRSAARRRKPISGYSVAPRGGPRGHRTDQDYSVPELAGSEAISAEREAYRHCPRCGAEHYTQSPARR